MQRAPAAREPATEAGAREQRWSSSTVLGILRNPRYAGFSVYTDRTQRATGNKRRSWYAQVLRDDNNEPVKGQWEPIFSEDICGPCSAA